MIVFDTSTLVGVAIRKDGTPGEALAHALARGAVAVSGAMLDELRSVLGRPRLARFVTHEASEALLAQLAASAVLFEPVVRVTECRDAKDDKVLELALACQADLIIASDDDLLVLDPWRGVRIVTPREYLDLVGAA